MLAAGFALAEEMWDFNTNDYAVEGYSGPGGDVVIRRLDTAPVYQSDGDSGEGGEKEE